MKANRVQRILSLLLVCVMVLGMIPAVSAATAETKIEGTTIVGTNVSSAGLYPVTKIVDGDTSYNNFWETTSAASAYVTFDLGSGVPLSQIKVYPRRLNADTYKRCIKDYAVYVSETAPTYSETIGEVPEGLPETAVIEGSMALMSGSAYPGTITLPADTTGRYVTIYIKNIHFASGHPINICEVEFYAKDTVTELPLTNATASSQANASYSASKAIDGNTGSGWYSDDKGFGDAAYEQWIQVELAEASELNRLDLYPRKNGDLVGAGFPEDFEIQVSADGQIWTTVKNVTGYKPAAQAYQTFTFTAQKNVKYIKVVSRKMTTENAQYPTANRFCLMEMKAYRDPDVVSVVEYDLKGSSVTASSDINGWRAASVIDGSSSKGWSSDGPRTTPDYNEWIQLALAEEISINQIVLVPRDTLQNFPVDFTIQVSADGETWKTAVKKTDFKATNKSGETFIFTTENNVKYIKVDATKLGLETANANSTYHRCQIMEIKAMQVTDSFADRYSKNVTGLSVDYAAGEVVLPAFDLIRTVEIVSSTNPEAVALDGTVDTTNGGTAQVVLKLTDVDGLSALTAPITVTVTGNEARLQAAADKVNLIPCPAAEDTQITLPTLDGYTITIKESSDPNVVALDGTINRPAETTGVRLTLTVKENATGLSTETKPLLVPIYKLYTAPTMTADEIAAIKEDYEDNAYGVFIHYVSEFNQYGGSRYADATAEVEKELKTVDEAANAFDPAAFAKTMHDVGAEYVVLTLWHGNMRTLFPSMTNQRWRDDRRAEGSTSAKSYADQDVITALLDELDKYGIDLHLYVHPSDGHDLSSEDQKLTSWGNNNTWNQYVNELLYEVCERYGTRIKGLWFDGMFSNINDGARLRKTCLSFNPAMVLTMNVGLGKEGSVYTSPHSIVDYRAWEMNSTTKPFEEFKFSRHQTAAMVDSTGLWWIAYGQQESIDKNVTSKQAEDMFRYIVAMSSISKDGGLLAATGFYPTHEGETLDSYLYPVVYEQLSKLNNNYLKNVKESIFDTNDSTAYPTTENLTVKQLEWGVANESKDGKFVYLHVLNAPEGTLQLPETADGTVLSKNAVILNFDGTQTPVSVEKTDSGYAIDLPEGTEWSEVDTVIKARRATDVVLKVTGEAETTIDTEELSYTVSVEDADKLATMTIALKLENMEEPVVELAGETFLIAKTYKDGVLNLVLCNNAGIDGSADLFTIHAAPTDVGEASVTVTKARFSAYTGESEAYVNVSMENASCVTRVDYGTYDVNHDGIVDQLDITRAQRWYGTDNAVCDVNEDGIVNIDDMILIMNNFDV